MALVLKPVFQYQIPWHKVALCVFTLGKCYFGLLQSICKQKKYIKKKIEMIVDLKTFVHCFSVGIGGTFSIYCGNVLLVLIVCFFAMPETQVKFRFY